MIHTIGKGLGRVSGAVEKTIDAGRKAAVANATVLRDAIPETAAQLAGVPIMGAAKELGEQAFAIKEFKRRGLYPEQYQAHVPRSDRSGRSKSYRDSLNGLPPETREQINRKAVIQSGLEAVASAVFPNWWAESFIDRANKVGIAMGIKNEPTDQHLAEKPLTRGVKILGDVAARATPAIAVLTGAIGPVEGLLVSELATAVNTLASSFAYEWRQRIERSK